MSYWCWCYWQNNPWYCRISRQIPRSLFMVCGDTNGRTATLNDYIVYNNCDHLPLPDFYTENSNYGNQRSMDRAINSQDRRIIDLCQMCNLKILNGREGANANRQICLPRFQRVKHYWLFYESPALFWYCTWPPGENEFSDHCPVELILVRSQLKKTRKVTWDAEKVNNYRQNLSSEMAINKFNHMSSLLEQAHGEPSAAVNEALSAFIDGIRSAVDPLFYKSFEVKIPSTNNKRHHKQPIWANEEWTAIRKKSSVWMKK